MAKFFSVIIPVYNCENYTIATLKSIEKSLDYFYRNNPLASEFEAEVIIVNDHSTDNTLSLVDNFVRYKKYYTVLNHCSNFGAATARNTGVKLSQGEFLFFCDGDDLFLEHHIDYCLRVFQDIENKSPEKLLGAVKTKMKIPGDIHPQWKVSIEHCSPINLCVRRQCHEFLEGFPEHFVYKHIGGEDCAYNSWLNHFFPVATINVETVEYVLRSGNSLDRQLPKFQRPPGTYQEEPSAKEKLWRSLANQVQESHFSYLQEKQKRVYINPEKFIEG